MWQADMLPFRQAVAPQTLAGIMRSTYCLRKMLTACPQGFSPYWIQEILRKRMGFQGGRNQLMI